MIYCMYLRNLFFFFIQHPNVTGCAARQKQTSQVHVYLSLTAFCTAVSHISPLKPGRGRSLSQLNCFILDQPLIWSRQLFSVIEDCAEPLAKLHLCDQADRWFQMFKLVEAFFKSQLNWFTLDCSLHSDSR